MKSKGFTLIEILIAIVIFSILTAVVIADFSLFSKRSSVDQDTQEFAEVLKLAQSKALSSENSSQYGVYIDTGVSPQKYVLYKGTTYATRDTTQDQPHWISKLDEFYLISLGGVTEVAFQKITGSADQSGNVSIRYKQDTSQNKTIYISSAGTISFSSSTPSDSNRTKDSRHLYFNYSRSIDTINENITLTFDGSTDQVIPIDSNLIGGQIDWQGTVVVGGSNQVVRIHTLRLNNPDTQFSIFRDRRYNTKSLVVTISGEGGNLASYSADGLTTNYTSVYVSSFAWQ